jgi:hypothetical protein
MVILGLSNYDTGQAAGVGGLHGRVCYGSDTCGRRGCIRALVELGSMVASLCSLCSRVAPGIGVDASCWAWANYGGGCVRRHGMACGVDGRATGSASSVCSAHACFSERCYCVADSELLLERSVKRCCGRAVCE